MQFVHPLVPLDRVSLAISEDLSPTSSGWALELMAPSASRHSMMPPKLFDTTFLPSLSPSPSFAHPFPRGCHL